MFREQQTWWQIVAHVRGSYPIRDAERDWLCIAWGEETVQLKYLVLEGRGRVLVAGDVCLDALVPAADVLAIGARLLVGSLIVVDRVITLRHILTLGRFEASGLDETIIKVRQDAASVRRELCARGSAHRSSMQLGQY